jgi:hypothetical protein
MAFMNKKFIKIYLILFFISFAFIAPQMRKFVKVPVISSLIKKTTTLAKTLKTFEIPIAESLDLNGYNKISTQVLSLPGIQDLHKKGPENKLICTYDSSKISDLEIVDAIVSSGFTPVILSEEEKKQLEIDALEKKYDMQDDVSEK